MDSSIFEFQTMMQTVQAGMAGKMIVECPAFFEPAFMRETLSQGVGHGTKEEAHS